MAGNFYSHLSISLILENSFLNDGKQLIIEGMLNGLLLLRNEFVVFLVKKKFFHAKQLMQKFLKILDSDLLNFPIKFVADNFK